MKQLIQNLRQYLLSGVSFAIPFIACGGILIAFSVAFVPMSPTGPDFSHSPTLALMNKIGVAAFELLLPVLAGYISHAIAGKPGLVPGFVGGYLCGHIPVGSKDLSTGFLGALIIGLVAGYVVNLIKKLPVPKYVKPIMPILTIPVTSSLFVGFLVLEIIGIPLVNLMAFLGSWLQTMDQGNAVILAMVLGAMIAFDMGGPVNKAAFFFGSAMIKEGNYTVMGCIAAAICTPPLGMGLATLLGRKLWNEEQREAGAASLAMGMIGITEGAIPFGASDPFRIIPCLMLGSMTGAAIAALGAVGDHAPHGGPIVILVVDNKLMYILAIVVGMFVTALSANLIKSITAKKIS